ncbi:hypothetical protein ACTXT7_007778 [Hymenolepis weldensis]
MWLTPKGQIETQSFKEFVTCSLCEQTFSVSLCIAPLPNYQFFVNEQRSRIRSTTLSYFVQPIPHNPDCPRLLELPHWSTQRADVLHFGPARLLAYFYPAWGQKFIFEIVIPIAKVLEHI